MPSYETPEAAVRGFAHLVRYRTGQEQLMRTPPPASRVSKRWFSWSDTYGIDINKGEDDVLILASAVVIDLVSHPDKND